MIITILKYLNMFMENNLRDQNSVSFKFIGSSLYVKNKNECFYFTAKYSIVSGKSFSILKSIKKYVQDNKIQSMYLRNDCRCISNCNTAFHWANM